MFRDEYLWSDCADAIISRSTLLVRGARGGEREEYFLQQWRSAGARTVVIDIDIGGELNACVANVYSTDVDVAAQRVQGPLLKTVRRLFAAQEYMSSVVIDITGMDHVAIMLVVKILASVPVGELFGLYVEPDRYEQESIRGDFALSDQFLGNKAVPGFARRERGTERTMVTFFGFEGDRVNRILEDRTNISHLIPVVGVPSYRPGWNLVSLGSFGRIVARYDALSDIQSCPAFSVYEAFCILCEIRSVEGNGPIVVAPLGTRPHTLACSLFASQNEEVRIAYDHPVESAKRASGVGCAHAYHLSGLLR